MNNQLIDSKIPVYRQIQDYILEKIADNEWPVGQKIPTEMEMARQFAVSRMTVNKAVSALRDQGVLTRIAGNGTFVGQTLKLVAPLTTIADLADEVRQRGGCYRAEVLMQTTVVVQGREATGLGVSSGRQADYVEILHFDNDRPLMLEKRYVNPTYAADFIRQDFSKITPTAYLLQYFPLTEIEQSIEAVNALPEWQDVLQLSGQTACLRIFRRTWSGGDLISYACLIAVGARYQLHSRYVPFQP